MGNPRSGDNPLASGGGGGNPTGGTGSLDVLVLEPNSLPAGTAADPPLQWSNDASKPGIYADSNGDLIAVKSGFNAVFISVNSGGLSVRSNGYLGFSDSTVDVTSAKDSYLKRVAPGVLSAADATGNDSTGFFHMAGQTRVTGDVTVTNSTSFADATGLSVSLAAGRTYQFRALLFFTTVNTSGVKVQLTGTATHTNIIADMVFINVSAAPPAILNTTSTRTTAKDTPLGVTASGTLVQVEIEGTTTVNAAGTFKIQFAQNAETGAAESVICKQGSTLTVTDLA